MKPVFQTITKHDPANGQHGDCMRAAMASLMDLPFELVPHFCEGLNGMDGREEGRRVNRWLWHYGLTMVDIAIPAEHFDLWKQEWKERGVSFYHLISGRSPRGFFHACVGRNGEIVHDPHPEGGGLEPFEGVWYIGALVRNGGDGSGSAA